MKYKRKNVICGIFCVLSVRMSGEILEDQKFRQYGPGVNQVHLLFLFSRKNPIKSIKCKSKYYCDQNGGKFYQ